MMKNNIKHYVLIFLCAFSVSAMANVQNNEPLANGMGNGSYFDRLEEKFNNAETAQEIDILGWTSGRCFYQSTPNVARNVLIAGFIGNALIGPGFDPQHKYTLLVNEGGDPNYFDNIDSASNLLINHINNAVIREAKPSMQEDGSLIVNAGPRTIYNVRKGSIGLESDREYLLSKMSSPDGTIYSYCYYFKKVREEY